VSYDELHERHFLQERLLNARLSRSLADLMASASEGLENSVTEEPVPNSPVDPSTSPHPSNSAPDPSVSRLTRERLLDLAYDVSSYLRRHAEPAVRISAALLLAASLSACGADQRASSPDADAVPTVAPLTQEVRAGMPQTPGRYDIVPDSIRRDEQGVYHFAWFDPGEHSGQGHDASASLLKLAEGSTDYLEVPPIGDPTLFLRHNSQIALSSMDQRQYNGGMYGYVPSYVYWRPFYTGVGYAGYYNPPVRTIPSSGTVDGSRVSSSPPAPAERTIGLRTAVAGRAGGTGSGSAASGKSGAGVTSSGGKGSVTSPSSSGFSGGGAATGKSGGSSGGSAGSSSS
jgi:hypothetical protein